LISRPFSSFGETLSSSHSLYVLFALFRLCRRFDDHNHGEKASSLGLFSGKPHRVKRTFAYMWQWAIGKGRNFTTISRGMKWPGGERYDGAWGKVSFGALWSGMEEGSDRPQSSQKELGPFRYPVFSKTSSKVRFEWTVVDEHAD
jgi:hypothetical protein